MNKKTVRDIEVKGKKVLLRVDFNVPMDENGNITDDKRIVESLPTIKYLIEQNAKVILMSHLGRPKGINDKLRMDLIAKRLGELLNKKVIKADDCVGDGVKKIISEMNFGDVLLLENVRFHPDEKNDESFAKELASLAEVFVNDAFGSAHRAHSSTYSVAKFLPAVAGFLMEKEISIMGKALEKPERPFVAILGGAKVSDKIKVIENLLTKVDTLLIGGAMANTFLRACGYQVGKSKVESDKVDLAKQLLNLADEKKVKLELPDDIVVADKFEEDAESKIVKIDSIPADMMALDIGPQTVEKFSNILKDAKTIIWNGPLGVFEFEKFANGSYEIAKAISRSGAVTIIGGGDSAAFVDKYGLSDNITHISTGGGASLEFMEGRVLPGVDILLNK